MPKINRLREEFHAFPMIFCQLDFHIRDDADAVVAVSPLVQQEFQAMTRTPVELITNGYDECDFPEGRGKDAAGGEDKDFIITHTGLFAADGNPTTLWKVLSEKCAKDETFEKALKSIDRFDGKKDIRAWLFTIAKNSYYTYCNFESAFR